MVPPRRRAPVSYHETVSDDEDSQEDDFEETGDESPQPSPRPSRRRQSPAARRQVAGRTRGQPRKSYTEEFSADDDDNEFSDGMDEDDEEPNVTRHAKARKPTARTRGRPKDLATTTKKQSKPRSPRSPPNHVERYRPGSCHREVL